MKDLFSRIFKKVKSEFLTIPNMLSLVRLCMIPLIVYFYVKVRNNIAVCILVLVSSATDVVDGFIARHFNMVTDFGKFLDPLADKLTQLSIILCLSSTYHLMLVPFSVLAIKEIGALLMRLVLFQKTNYVGGAVWHGKLSTVLIITMVGVHLLWGGFSPLISNIMILSVTVFMSYSAIMYAIDCAKQYKRIEGEGKLIE